MKLVYDGDGNRLQETVGTTTTSYLVADQNLTGYAQVLDELQNNTVSRTYSYGLELINETQTISSTLSTSFYTQAVTEAKRKAQSKVVEMIVPKKAASWAAPA